MGLFVLVGLGGSCRDDDDAPLPVVTTVPLEVLPESFVDVYPTFLLNKLSKGQKAALWASRYRGRWVRWSGEIISFTNAGMTFRQLAGTVTFDVSVQLADNRRDAIRGRVRPHQTVTYLGRLFGYDDVFRTFFLHEGVVLLDTLQDRVELPPIPTAGTRPVLPATTR